MYSTWTPRQVPRSTPPVILSCEFHVRVARTDLEPRAGHAFQLPEPVTNTHRTARRGALAVLQAASVTIATVVFLPGMLVRVCCQLLAARTSGMSIRHEEL